MSSRDQNIICTSLKKKKKKKKLPQIIFMINKWNPKQTEIAIDNLVKHKTNKIKRIMANNPHVFSRPEHNLHFTKKEKKGITNHH